MSRQPEEGRGTSVSVSILLTLMMTMTSLTGGTGLHIAATFTERSASGKS